MNSYVIEVGKMFPVLQGIKIGCVINTTLKQHTEDKTKAFLEFEALANHSNRKGVLKVYGNCPNLQMSLNDKVFYLKDEAIKEHLTKRINEIDIVKMTLEINLLDL